MSGWPLESNGRPYSGVARGGAAGASHSRTVYILGLKGAGKAAHDPGTIAEYVLHISNADRVKRSQHTTHESARGSQSQRKQYSQ